VAKKSVSKLDKSSCLHYTDRTLIAKEGNCRCLFWGKGKSCYYPRHEAILLTYLLTPRSRFLLEEANSFSTSQRIPRILLNHEGSSPHSQVPATCPYPEADRSRQQPPQPTSWRPIV